VGLSQAELIELVLGAEIDHLPVVTELLPGVLEGRLEPEG